jgi:transcriptional regulator with XRE-family HTH domain
MKERKLAEHVCEDAYNRRVTPGKLLRQARLAAGLTQAELATRVNRAPQQIARYEADQHDVGVMTLRSLLKACGFDLPMTLTPYVVDEALEAELAAAQRLTPQQRLQALIDGLPPGSTFDPAATLKALTAAGVDLLLVGPLAGVVHGTSLGAASVDVVPRLSAGDDASLAHAVGTLGIDVDASAIRATATVDVSGPSGRVRIIGTPAGTSGWEDIRRRSTREHLGDGMRVSVAAVEDLIRIAEAEHDPERDEEQRRLRRILELTHDIGIER